MTRGGQKKRQNDESLFAMGPGPPPPWIGPGPPPPGGWEYEGPPPPGGWGPGGPPPPGGWGPGLPPPGGWGPGGPPLGGWGPDGPPPGGWGLPGPPPGGWGPDGPPPGGWGPGGPPPGGWGPGGPPPGSWEPGGPPPPDGWGPGGPPPGGWGPGGPPPPPEGWGPRGPPPPPEGWGPRGPPPPPEGWGPRGPPPPPEGWGPRGPPPPPDGWGPGGPPPGGWGPSRPPPGGWVPGGPPPSGGWLPSGLPPEGLYGSPDPNYVGNPQIPPMGCGPIAGPPPPQGFAPVPMMPGYGPVGEYGAVANYATIPPPTWPNEARTCFPPNQEVIVNPTPDQPAWIKALISGPEITEKTTEDTSLKKSKQPKDEAKVSTKKAKRQGLLGTRTFDKPPPGRSTGIISFIGPTYGFIEREDLKKFTFSFDAFFGSRKALAPGVRVHFTACKEMSNEIATDVKVAPGGTENVDTEIYEGVVIESYTEAQIGVKQKPGYVEVIVGPEKSKLPYEKRDCAVTLLTGDHVLINLLTDIVTQNKRATNIKPKIPATFKHTAEKREMGAILNIKETEGTIVSKDNPNLPFDLTENLGDTEFSPTDAVEFTVLSVKGKKVAIRVRKLKGGSVQFDSGTQGVLEEIKEKEETKKKDEVALAKDKWKPVSLAVPPVMTAVEEDISNEQYEGTVLKAIVRNPLHPLAEGQEPEKGRLVMTMAGEQKHLTFEPQDIRTTATMLDGDKINFNISTHRETKKERAINIKISPETFAESTEQRRTGMVVEIEDQSGVIKCQQNPQLFFHMSEVMEFKKLELNEKVEFSVIPHETAEGGSQAIRIKRLTERVFLPVPKLGGMATQKIKKQMTIKLMKDSPTNFDDKGKPEDKEEKLSNESDKLKAVVKTLRSKDTKPSTGRKDGDGSRRRNEHSRSRSRSRSRSPVKDEFGRQKRLQSSSREQDRHSKSRRSRSRERSRRRSRSRSRSRDRMGSKGRSSQRSRRDSSLPPEDPRHSSGVDDELARKKRELEELNDMIARRKAMVTMVPRGGIMDMRPMEKTCIDYDHGRIAVPITEFKPVKSILKKRTESVSGPLFPIKNEPPDHDQYHYNPPTLDHIQSFDSPDQSHLLYSQRSSKMSYYDDSSYEQTSTQDHFYQSQSVQEHSALVTPHSAYQSPPSQPNPSQPTPNQLSPQRIPPTQSPPCQSPPSSKQTPHSLLSSQSALHPIIPEQPSSVPSSSSKQSSSPPGQMSSPEGKHNLTTQISRFLNILNKGVDASLFSTVVKEAQDEIAVSADNVQVVPTSHPEVKTGKYDPHRVREADQEKTFRFSRDVLRTHDKHDSGINTDHSQDDLLPHERAIQDGSGFSRILSMAQEKYSPSAYQKATDMDEDEKFLYHGKDSAADDEHYRSSSGSREKQKPVREGRKLSPTRQTREGSTSKSEHFDKIQSLLRSIGLNLDTGEASKLADRTQERLYGRAEKSSSERGSTEHREREHLSSRREERRRSRTGSADSEHPRSISPTRVPSRTAYSSYEPTSEYSGFLDQAEEEALEKARQMQSLTMTVRNAPEQTMPITPPSNPTLVTSSSAMYPHQQPGYSYAISEYGWHQGASTQYAVPPSSAAPSSSQQAPEVYQQAQYSSYGGHTSSLPSHYFGQPSPGPPPISPYPLQSLAPTVQSTSLAKPQQINTLIQVKPLTSTSDNSKQTSVSRCLKVIETVTTETIQKDASKSAKVVQFNLQSSEAAQPHAASTLGEKTLSETEDDIEAKQKKRLEQFNQRMMEKSKQQFTQRKNDKLTRHTQARNKHQNNPPGKVVSTEPRNIWICGHSLIYWAEMRAKSPEVGMQLGMDPSNVVVWWKGMQGMTWPQLLPQLLQLKIKWPNPDVIIMHLGGNDLGTDSPTDLLASVKKDLTSMRSIFPQCLLVWSDILPRRVWRHSEDSLEVDLVRATVNRRVHSIIAELGGTALTHDNIRCGTDTGLYRPDGVHLSGKGIDTYNLNLQDFLEKWEIEANNATE